MDILDFKGIIPFRQKFVVDNKEFELLFEWRKIDDSIMYTLFDSNSNLICEREPMIYGEPLWSKFLPDKNYNIRQDYPQKLLVPLSNDGEEKIGIDNIFKTIFITLQEPTWYSIRGRQ